MSSSSNSAEKLEPVFQLGDAELYEFTCGVCLEVIRKCVRCVNGHPFCVECAGQCGLKQLQEILMIARDEVDNFGFHDDDFLQTVDSWVWRLKQDRKLPDRYRMIRLSMFFDDDQRPRSARTAVTLPRIRCPTCRTQGPFTRHRETDAAVALLPVSCPYVDPADGAECRWCGPLERFDDHQHIFKDEQRETQQPAATESRGIKRRRPDNDDEDAGDGVPPPKVNT